MENRVIKGYIQKLGFGRISPKDYSYSKSDVFFIVSAGFGFSEELYANKFFKKRLLRHYKNKELILIKYVYDSEKLESTVIKITLLESAKQAKRRLLKENNNG